MQRFLPLGGLRYATDAELEAIDLTKTHTWDPCANQGFFVCCDVSFPEEHHVKWNFLPPLPIKRKIYWQELSPWTQSVLRKKNEAPSETNQDTWCVERLVADLKDRTAMWIHFAHLKTAVALGVKCTNVRKAILFDQAPFMKSYVDYACEKRRNATSEREREECKLSINSNYGSVLLWLNS